MSFSTNRCVNFVVISIFTMQGVFGDYLTSLLISGTDFRKQTV